MHRQTEKGAIERTVAFNQDLIYSLRMDVCHTVSLFKSGDKTSHQIYALWPFERNIKSSSLSLSRFLTCTNRWPSQDPFYPSKLLDSTFFFLHHFLIASQPLVPRDSTLSLKAKKKKYSYLSQAGDKSQESEALLLIDIWDQPSGPRHLRVHYPLVPSALSKSR